MNPKSSENLRAYRTFGLTLLQLMLFLGSLGLVIYFILSYFMH